jgi:hypothetical protein
MILALISNISQESPIAKFPISPASAEGVFTLRAQDAHIFETPEYFIYAGHVLQYVFFFDNVEGPHDHITYPMGPSTGSITLLVHFRSTLERVSVFT